MSTLFLAFGPFQEGGVYIPKLKHEVLTPILINRCAIDGITVYGNGDAGIYCLDNLGKWKQISSEVLGEVISLAVINNRLYTAINERGIFHIPLGEE